MDHKRRYLYVLLVLCTLLSCHAATSPQNACGGTAILTNQPMSWCDPGEHASSTPDCRLGVFHCAGPNTVICMPIDCPESNRYQSSFIANKQNEQPPIPVLPLTKTCAVDCGERGHCDRLEGVCVCNKGWSGEKCDKFTDPCSSPFATCGDHGACFGTGEGAYRCECEQGWTGSSCNVPTQCLPNGLWIASSKKCSCFEGWEGPLCAQCNPDFLCVPTKNREQPFALTYVPKDTQKEFLKGDLGDEYAASHPIRPNSTYEDTLYDCACKPVPEERQEERLQENLIYYDDLTGSFYVQHDPYAPSSSYYPYHSRYAHDYYWRYHYDPNSAALALSLVVGLFFFLLIWVWFRTPDAKSISKTESAKRISRKEYVRSVSNSYGEGNILSTTIEPIQTRIDIHEESAPVVEYKPKLIPDPINFDEEEEEDMTANFTLDQF